MRQVFDTDHLPDLHVVVFGHGAHNPRLVRVPREVRDLRRVTSVNELQTKKAMHTPVLSVQIRMFGGC